MQQNADSTNAAPAEETTALHATLDLNRQNFGQMLLESRLAREMTVAEVAEKAHMKRDTLMHLESGDLASVQLKPYYAKSAIETLCLVYDIAPAPILDANELDASEYLARTGGTDAPSLSLPGDEEANSAATQHQVAQMLIAIVLIAVAVLIAAGWFYKAYQARNQKAIRHFDLTELLPQEPPPMETLKIP